MHVKNGKKSEPYVHAKCIMRDVICRRDAEIAECNANYAKKSGLKAIHDAHDAILDEIFVKVYQ